MTKCIHTRTLTKQYEENSKMDSEYLPCVHTTPQDPQN